MFLRYLHFCPDFLGILIGKNCIRHDSKPLKHLTTIHHFCSIRCSYGNTWEFCKSVTERKEKRNENWICKRWRKKNIWNCKNYLFFSYILKLHIEVYLELSKNPPSHRPRTLVIHCVKSVQIRRFFWSVFSCIQSKYRKLLTRKSSIGTLFT